MGELRIEDEINSLYGDGIWFVFKARERTHTYCIRPFAQRERRANRLRQLRRVKKDEQDGEVISSPILMDSLHGAKGLG